jgi:hypothetical protein
MPRYKKTVTDYSAKGMAEKKNQNQILKKNRELNYSTKIKYE